MDLTQHHEQHSDSNPARRSTDAASPAASTRRPGHHLLSLQRAVGNAAVVRMLSDGNRDHALPAPQVGMHAHPSAISSRAPVVQRYFDLKQASQAKLGVKAKNGTSFPGHQRDDENADFLEGTEGTGEVNRVDVEDVPDLLVSDDGEMAIEAAVLDGNREVEGFFASKTVLTNGKNKLSKVNSQFTLADESGQGIKVPDLNTNKLHDLVKVVGAKAGTYIFSKRPKGNELEGLEQCIEMAEALIGSQTPKFLLEVVGEDPTINTRDLAQQMLLYIGAYIDAYRPGGKHEGDHASSQEVAKEALNSPPPMPERETWQAPIVEVTAASNQNIRDFNRALGRHTAKNKFKAVFNTNLQDPQSVGEKVKMRIQVVSQDWADTWQTVLEDDDVKSHIEGYEFVRKEVVQKAVDVEKASAMLEQRKLSLIDKINKSPEIFTEINKELGMNEHADPDVGEAYEIFHKGDGSKATFPYHFAGVVAKSGPDSVTFENYARDRKSSSGSDQRMYFQMYGPKRDIAETETGIEHAKPGEDETAEEQEDRERGAGSFHGKWKGIFTEAQTVVVGKKSRKK